MNLCQLQIHLGEFLHILLGYFLESKNFLIDGQQLFHRLLVLLIFGQHRIHFNNLLTKHLEMQLHFLDVLLVLFFIRCHFLVYLIGYFLLGRKLTLGDLTLAIFKSLEKLCILCLNSFKYPG